jgi:hypothetical protein
MLMFAGGDFMFQRTPKPHRIARESRNETSFRTSCCRVRN